MKKYLYIYKSELISSLSYIFNILIGFISYLVLMFIFLNLWKTIYSDPDEVISGYTMSNMIWYVAITEIIYKTMQGRKFCRQIVNDVRGGNIAYNINKPYSFIGYSLSKHLGEITINGIMYSIFALILGFIFLGEFPDVTIISVLAVILTLIISITINTLLVISIGLISFFIEDSNPIYWIYSKFLLIIGTLFPIEVFPIWMQGPLKYSPIYAMIYGPAKLFVDFSPELYIKIFISQIFYLIIGVMIALLLYKKGVKKLNVNGG